jgi:hypothetical protein
MIKLINILKEIRVAAPTPFHKILKAYIDDLVKKEYTPDASPDFESLTDYFNSIDISSVKNTEQLALALKAIHNDINDLLGEPTDAYYDEALRYHIPDICAELNVSPQMTEDLINELDKLFDYNEEI